MIAGLIGQAFKLYEQPVIYGLYLFSGDDTKVKVGKGSHILIVIPAYGTVESQLDKTQIKRVIQEVDVRFVQTLGPKCDLILKVERAKRGPLIGTPDSLVECAFLSGNKCSIASHRIRTQKSRCPQSSWPIAAPILLGGA